MSICKVCGMSFVNNDCMNHHINIRHLRTAGENDFIKLLDKKAEQKGFKTIILTKEQLDNYEDSN